LLEAQMPRKTAREQGQPAQKVARLEHQRQGSERGEPKITIIAMQVGSELRIRNTGEVVQGNEGSPEDHLADAVLHYRFDVDKEEHVFRLLDPRPDRRASG
jgi:hypothetical protein